MFPVFLIRIDGSRLCRNHLLEARMIFVEPYAPNTLALTSSPYFCPGLRRNGFCSLAPCASG